MMDYLIGTEITSKHSLHDEPVFCDISMTISSGMSWRKGIDVSMPLMGSAAFEGGVARTFDALEVMVMDESSGFALLDPEASIGDGRDRTGQPAAAFAEFCHVRDYTTFRGSST